MSLPFPPHCPTPPPGIVAAKMPCNQVDRASCIIPPCVNHITASEPLALKVTELLSLALPYYFLPLPPARTFIITPAIDLPTSSSTISLVSFRVLEARTLPTFYHQPSNLNAVLRHTSTSQPSTQSTAPQPRSSESRRSIQPSPFAPPHAPDRDSAAGTDLEALSQVWSSWTRMVWTMIPAGGSCAW
jgi:hypothetical protein